MWGTKEFGKKFKIFLKKGLTKGFVFDILIKLAREGVRKAPERGSGPNLENDTEKRNAQEERQRRFRRV